MKKTLVALGLSATLLLATPVAAEAAPVLPTTFQAAGCGNFWLRAWIVFTQPSYAAHLYLTGKCG